MKTTHGVPLTNEYMHVDTKTGAQALHLAIAYHAAHVADAVAWADASIGAVESPPDEMVEISIAGRLQSGAVIDLLSDVPGIPGAARRSPTSIKSQFATSRVYAGL